jgi:arylsulfatase A-like enzyme
VITADHGEAFYKHNETYHGISVYDEPMRVPLIVLDPRQSGCKYEERLCRTVDIVPTMLDLAGFKVRG